MLTVRASLELRSTDNRPSCLRKLPPVKRDSYEGGKSSCA